jgi:glutathione S-transferase
MSNLKILMQLSIYVSIAYLFTDLRRINKTAEDLKRILLWFQQLLHNRAYVLASRYELLDVLIFIHGHLDL